MYPLRKENHLRKDRVQMQRLQVGSRVFAVVWIITWKTYFENVVIVMSRSICHPECRDLVPLPCIVAQSATPRGAVPGVLADYAPLEAPMIPALIVHCAQEVEARGLNEQGIYRVPG